MKVFIASLVLATFAFIVQSDPNPLNNLDTCGIVKYYKYPCDVYSMGVVEAFTQAIHRIPSGLACGALCGKKGPVLMMHDVLGSSADWVMLGPKYSLAFLLADKGYDVWLLNMRGNVYSSVYQNFTLLSSWFTNTSYNYNYAAGPLAQKDLKYYVTNINAITGSQVYYIGVGLGATLELIYACSVGVNDGIIKLAHLIAPLAFMAHTTEPYFQYLNSTMGTSQWITNNFGQDQFMTKSDWNKFWTPALCQNNSWVPSWCQNAYVNTMGFSPTNVNNEDIEVILNHVPAGTSTQVMMQLAQWMNNIPNLTFYDFGKDVNPSKYNGSETPNYFRLNKSKTPVALHYSNADTLASDQDMPQLITSLNPKMVVSSQSYNGYSHGDFTFSRNCIKDVYQNIMNLMALY